ncbi:uncharacterized protein LOC125905065, partial [Scomber scombrus]
QTFQNFSTFKSHTYRHNKHVVRPTSGVVELTCHVDFCSARCETDSLLLSLETHIREGPYIGSYIRSYIRSYKGPYIGSYIRSYKGPYRHCSKSSTFTSHMSKKHKTGTEEHLVESVVNPGVSHESEQDQSDMQIDPPSDAADESQFFKNVALFFTI